jgi:uncharacterized membrane protein YhaH (DUF805 family)
MITHPFLQLASFDAARNMSLFIFGAIFVIACIVVAVAAEWKIFVKAGRPGWAAIVPLYNTWVLFEISGKPGWWALLGLIPYLGWLVLMVLYVIAILELSRRFGKDTLFAVFGLFIFQIVGFIILGFGDAEYKIPPPEQSFHAPTTE